MDIHEQLGLIDELTKKDQRIKNEIKTLAEKAERDGETPGTKTRLANLTVASARVDEQIKELREVDTSSMGNVAFESGAETSVDVHYDGTNLKSAAMRTLDRAVKSGKLPEHAAAKTENLIKRAGTESARTIAARWATATGDLEYLGAFCKIAADPTRGHLVWTEREHDAYRKVAAVQAEMKAMSVGTDTAGGFMVPLTLDPTILLTSAGSINPLREISRIVQTATDQWQGVSSAGVSGEWKAEGAEATAVDPTLGDEPIPVHFGDVYTEFSFEIEMDVANFIDELTKVLMDAAAQLTATAYTSGTGTGQPTGIITALDGTSSEVSPATAETFASVDVYETQNALSPRFSARAQWCAEISTINEMAQFETTAGARLFPEIADGRLLRKPLHELSNMDAFADVDPAVTADNHILLYGDFTNFVIVDRIGSTMEFLPMVVGTNRRPTGQRGAFLWFRTGSNVVVPNSFRVLNIATTL